MSRCLQNCPMLDGVARSPRTARNASRRLTSSLGLTVALICSPARRERGCDGSSDGEKAAQPPIASGTESTGRTPTISATGNGNGNKRDPWLIRWISNLGPGGPGGGEDYAWDAYGALEDHDCRTGLKLGDNLANSLDRYVYAGASNACLAAFEGEEYRWTQAAAALESANSLLSRGGESSDNKLSCYDQSAFNFLRALVDQHEKDPGRPFAIEQSKEASTSCLRFIRLDPSKGSIAGGYKVTIVGEHLRDDLDIQIEPPGGARILVAKAESMNSSATRLTFEMPASANIGTATVFVQENSRGEAVLYFTFVA